MALKKFSNDGIPTQAISFTELTKNSEHYTSKILRQMFVVLLASEENIETFHAITHTHNITFQAYWLVIFMKSLNEKSRNLCEYPRPGLFKLAFNTQMIVNCEGNNNLREWYSVFENKTEIFELATWNPENGLNLKTHKDVYQRRNLQGITLKIVKVKF